MKYIFNIFDVSVEFIFFFFCILLIVAIPNSENGDLLTLSDSNILILFH